LCPSPSQASDNSEIDDTEDLLIDEKLKKAKLESVFRLSKLGLTAEQIAQALDLPLQLILDNLQ
jgi:predicted transposase YdaD